MGRVKSEKREASEEGGRVKSEKREASEEGGGATKAESDEKGMMRGMEAGAGMCAGLPWRFPSSL